MTGDGIKNVGVAMRVKFPMYRLRTFTKLHSSSSSDPAAHGLLPFGSVTYSENDMCLLVD